MTPEDFSQRLQSDDLALCLVGMSNVGKSFWSKKLKSEMGFQVVGCDDMIEKELALVLKDAGHNKGIAAVAEWMAQPYDSGYEAAAQQYLELETQTLQRVLTSVAAGVGQNTVIDTTGSIAHIDADIRKAITAHSVVVYLEASDTMVDEMLQKYLACLKPVVWGDMFRQLNGESNEAALLRNYPKLLAHRAKLYQEMTHVTISINELLIIKSAADFLAVISYRLTAESLRERDHVLQ